MRVKHLDEIYTWSQIRKMQRVYDANPHNDFVPIALYAPGKAHESRCSDGRYEWYGRIKPYYAKRIWERARRDLAPTESHALAYEVVPASECFNTIRFLNVAAYREYVSKFWELLKFYANSGTYKCFVGKLPTREYPWEAGIPYEEYVISDDEDYRPWNSNFRNRTDYEQLDSLSWKDIQSLFIELSESELAFLYGGKIINKKPTPIDEELLNACENLNLPEMRRLLKLGANANAVSPSRDDSALEIVVNFFFDSEQELARICDAIDLLLEFGADIDFAPYEGSTPLHSSIWTTSPKIMKHLLARGADVNTASFVYPEANDICMPLDTIYIDMDVDGVTPELEEMKSLIESRGGKCFYKLVPEFYQDDV